MLKLIDIKKDYALDKESVTALSSVSIEFRKNEFVSILGPSGCGKTTLLNIIGGLDRYTSGDIQIDGISTKEYDDVDWDTYRNRRIGFVFQSYNLIPHMNILKNVALSLTLAGVGKEERYARALEALKKVGLDTQARKKPNQLSGGQMQRVAIARALVNNPEIILADEPTGALDSESGIQVMDLLKEVAQDRLVVMVTHNPALAEEYSTRIVYLKDGAIVGDTMPYNSADDVDEPVVDENQEVAEDTQKPAPQKQQTRTQKFFAKLKEKVLKLKNAEKTAMKLSTAISLSWTNLLAKKGRTLLTSIAGSIGIIGIILVLSLSTGATNYIASLEEGALSTYPLTIAQTNADMSSVLSMIMTPTEEEEKRVDHPNTDEIFTSLLLGKFLPNIKSILKKNDLKSFKAYLDENFNQDLATVRYNYGVNFNAYIQDPGNEKRYMKVNPYQEVMAEVLDKIRDEGLNVSEILESLGFGGMDLTGLMSMFTSGASVAEAWTEMTTNQRLLESQYELVGSQSRWPSSATDIVIVVDEKNQLIDFQYFMLGLISQDEVVSAIRDGADWQNKTTTIDELLSLKYNVLTEADYLEEDFDKFGNSLGTWSAHKHEEQSKAWIDEQNPLQLNVCGVIRPKAGVKVTSVNGVIGYTHALTELLFERAKQHPAIQRMYELWDEVKVDESSKDIHKTCINYSYNTENGSLKKIVANETEIDKTEIKSILRHLGVVIKEEPTSIEFYCTSFESKAQIIAFINEYNAYMREQDEDGTFSDVRYGDSLAVMMVFVNTMADTITGVLVAFAAISLVVSTIMIAIIIYTSVLERRKEIGVLRSIGARKKDVSRVFIAESAILGGYSGIIGVLVSAILAAVGSTILKVIFEIEDLMHITWWHCLMMFAISVVLSMFAGFIPSRIASKKDPAIALRSE